MHTIPSAPPPLINTSPIALPGTLEEQLARSLANVPSFIRLPQAGTRCPHTQLSRTALNELVAPTKRNAGKPPVQAVYQRAHRYAQRGTWLIPSENLFRYLLGLSSSSMEEYTKASDLRVPDSDDDTPAQAAALSRNTPKKGKEFPPRTPHTVEGLS